MFRWSEQSAYHIAYTMGRLLMMDDSDDLPFCSMDVLIVVQTTVSHVVDVVTIHLAHHSLCVFNITTHAANFVGCLMAASTDGHTIPLNRCLI